METRTNTLKLQTKELQEKNFSPINPLKNLQQEKVNAIIAKQKASYFLFEELPNESTFIEENKINSENLTECCLRITPTVNLMIYNNYSQLDTKLKQKIKKLIIAENKAINDKKLPTIGIELESLNFDSFEFQSILDVLTISNEKEDHETLEVNANFSYSN